MKQMKHIFTTVFVMMLMVTMATAQSRYKHVPRVKVEGNKVEKEQISQEFKNAPATVNSNVEYAAVENTNTTIEETAIATTSNKLVVEPIIKTKTVVKQRKSIKVNKKANKQLFTERVQNKSKLMDVKDVTKTNANVALILLIVFYILAFIFILIAVLMILGVIGVVDIGLFLAMLIIGIVFALAASVLLTLIKIGVV